MHQRLHHIDVVVYVFQQNTLIAERHAGNDRRFARIAQFGGRLLWMVHVDAHPKSVRTVSEFRTAPA